VWTGKPRWWEEALVGAITIASNSRCFRVSKTLRTEFVTPLICGRNDSVTMAILLFTLSE
jgi:hypothetical protein